MADTTQRSAVAEAISRDAVQILRSFTGRGPTKARTVIASDIVAIVLADALTKGERSLVALGEEQHVLHSRRNLQRVMSSDLVQMVEARSGRRVEAMLSDNHVDPDIGVEFFLLRPVAS